MTRWVTAALAGAFVSSGVIVASVVASMASCASTPTNTPLRSFEAAKNIDVVCMQVYTTSEADGGGGLPVTPPVPVPQDQCGPVPINTIGAQLPYHLFALVTQTLRGEVAVVDLTAGTIIDEDPSTPGVNFLPVGANPSGIAAAPNGAMAFVASADTTKPAIYGLPSTRILGAGVRYDGGIATVYSGAGPTAQIPTLPSWPACSLPLVPGPIVAVPLGQPGQSVGAGPLGGPPVPQVDYALAVVLPASPSARQAARVVMIDPAPLLRGAGIDVGPGPTVAPGSLDRCPIIGDVPLSNQFQAPDASGPAWDDGVRYVIDGGHPAEGDGAISPAAAAAGYEGPNVPLPLPMPSIACAAASDAAIETGPVDAATSPPPIAPPAPPLLNVAAARDQQFLYVTDLTLPIIHIVDLSNPRSPTEIEPLVATSASQPGRSVLVSGLAISPPTSVLVDAGVLASGQSYGLYARYLYAIDSTDTPASVIVYDVTDPVHSPHVPLTRPHPELTPQLPLDRIAFTAPVAAVAFAQHDFPLTQDPANGQDYVGSAGSGLICNPNANVNLFDAAGIVGDAAIDASYADPGAFYRYNYEVQQIGLGPSRLRGIFGFATLSNGDVMLIDVDDWDSPCRRPNVMSGFASDIAPPQVPTPGSASIFNPLDPYQVPEAGTTNGVSYVTNEAFFPVSQPHRPRSLYPLDNDPVLGPHFPEIVVQPQLYNLVTGAGLSPGIDAGNPNLFPTFTSLADPSDASTSTTGVRLAWEDPLVHQNQSWRITYEGVLPTFGGVDAYIQKNTDDTSTTPPYETLELSLPNGLFCRRGVEDLAIGQQRVAAAMAADGGVSFPPDADQWVGDYVQIADELLPQTDPYWALPGTGSDGCWGDLPQKGAEYAQERYQQCLDYFEPVIEQNITRDFPILEAHDNRLVISRFRYPVDPKVDAGVPESTTNRSVTAPDPSNAPFLKALKCCFHNQATFNVRTGGEWVATGSVSGLLHHVTTDPSGQTDRCVLSCNSQEALLNARSLGFLPPSAQSYTGPDRNSPLAMRNPMFAYFVTHPLGPGPTLAPTDPRYQQAESTCTKPDDGGILCAVQRVSRDLSWEFTTTNAFTNQVINLAGNGVGVSPQSMLFIPSIGQIALVDGAQDGLVLIDLGAVAVTSAPYF
jgi:hypothetical protein